MAFAALVTSIIPVVSSGMIKRKTFCAVSFRTWIWASSLSVMWPIDIDNSILR